MTNMENVIMGGVVLAIVFALIMWFFKAQTEDNSNNENVKKQREDDGVSKMLAALARYASLHDFTLITPAKVQSGEKSTDLDALLVTYAGVVGIKCIGYNGQIYANPGDATWLRVAGEQRTEFTNPFDQRAADVRVLRDVLANAKQRTVKIECLTVFTSKEASLAVPKSMAVLRSKDLTSLLGKEKYLADNGVDKTAVVEALKAAMQ
ncbi:MAG: nuclease-related domain-containing protein [Pygmaiobacter massiliensis]|uniref:nuclease-related domain-containing protein n=1 Tax=Pygmaiobacter massiliensis TaxID=1917873 RepID=UPI000C7DF1E5|nr:nuclease-related domain-containing protein [Pygmaiobacter massiliensis]MDD3202214.1 nuclease-related domain-containing protein [Pygmaiobacter massiliensis]MDY4784314.1 nuclease-related domain-containing protein [Pygmaiobacter massiliensis]